MQTQTGYRMHTHTLANKRVTDCAIRCIRAAASYIDCIQCFFPSPVPPFPHSRSQPLFPDRALKRRGLAVTPANPVLCPSLFAICACTRFRQYRQSLFSWLFAPQSCCFPATGTYLPCTRYTHMYTRTYVCTSGTAATARSSKGW